MTAYGGYSGNGGNGAYPAQSDGADTINVVELGHALRRGWRALVVSTVIGAAVGIAVLLFAPRRFGGSASLVVRSSQSGGAGLLSKLGLGDAAPAALSSQSPIETEVGIVSSRALVGRVVDSLELQAAVKSPKSVAARDVIGALRLGGSFAPAKYTVDHTTGTQYTLSSDDKHYTATAGTPVALPQGSIVLRADTALPPHFVLALLDREDAIDAASKSLSVSKTGTEILNIGYQAPDSMTAAAVPNALVAVYLQQRHTVDRGTNAHRVEFLSAQIDSISKQLRASEDSLRRFEEASGVLQPEVQGKLQLDQAADVRQQMASLDVERGALAKLIADIAAGRATPNQLAAYPSFLKSPGINELLTQLVQTESDRTKLLERRLDNDAEVVALTQSIKNIENQLSSLAAGYKSSLDRQRTDLAAQLDTISHALGTFPGAVESSGRLQRRAKELATTYAAMQAQLVEARLGAIGEGGDVHQLDVAEPPRKVAFPRPATTLGIGVAGGLFIGAILAILVGLLGRYVEDPQAIERTTGVPALRLEPGVPLLVAGRPLSNTLLLVPLDRGVSTAGVAERLVRTAMARGTQPMVLDLSGSSFGTPGTALTTDVSSTIHRLEQEHGMVIVRLPALAADETAAALNSERAVLLVAPAGRLERRVLVSAMQTLRRLVVPCAGVVVNRAGDAVVA
jgi:uncharacterized protein involved in exopolysaccharide biosynthesis